MPNIIIILYYFIMFNYLFQVGHFESVGFIKNLIPQRTTILKVNEKGTIVSSWHSTDGRITGICDIEIIGDKLLLGSPFNPFVGALKLPQDFL